MAFSIHDAKTTVGRFDMAIIPVRGIFKKKMFMTVSKNNIIFTNEIRARIVLVINRYRLKYENRGIAIK